MFGFEGMRLIGTAFGVEASVRCVGLLAFPSAKSFPHSSLLYICVPFFVIASSVYTIVSMRIWPGFDIFG